MSQNFMDVQIEVEDRVYGSDFAVMQWINGDPKQKALGGVAYTGGFFVSDDQQTGKLPGFEPHTLITRDGTEVAGQAARELTFAPIRRRQCWQVRPESGLSRRFPWSAYGEARVLGKPRSLVHVLAGIKDFTEPVVLSFGGLVAGKMVSGTADRGILLRHSSKVVSGARRLSRREGKSIPFPNCAFWLTVGAERNQNGLPVFSSVGEGDATSTVVYPQWLDEPEVAIDHAALNGRFVGREALALHQGLFTESEEWGEAWGVDALMKTLAAIGAADPAQLQIESSEAPF